MADHAVPGATVAAPRLTAVIVAATIGNILEWFDFLVYGFFAATLAEVFFPVGNPTVSLLITFGAFGLSYLVRPLGAAVIGTYTDRAGRKAGLTLSIALMMIGTTLMVVRPAMPRSASRHRSSSRSHDFSRGSRSGASSAVPLLFSWSMLAIAKVLARAGSGPAPASFRSSSRSSASP